MEQLQSLRDEWSVCQRCQLGCTATNHVLWRRTGPILTDVLFMGEAPGMSEDITGTPFDGPAGDRFDELIAAVVERIGKFNFIVTNPVACAPFVDYAVAEEPGQIRKPHVTEIHECMLRVIRLIEITKPRLVVLMGVVAESAWKQAMTPKFKSKHGCTVPSLLKTVCVRHPSFINRQEKEDDKILEFKRFVLAISGPIRLAVNERLASS